MIFLMGLFTIRFRMRLFMNLTIVTWRTKVKNGLKMIEWWWTSQTVDYSVVMFMEYFRFAGGWEAKEDEVKLKERRLGMQYILMIAI